MRQILVYICILLAGCSAPTPDPGIGYHLMMADSSFQKIKLKRVAALDKGVLVKSKSDYVPGWLYTPEDTIDVQARLKGDHTDHLEGAKWSFRIVAQDQGILGHQKISIQGPERRMHLNEWVFHQLLKNEDLIHLQYQFHPFCVNDTLCGIYAFESHFDSQLLTIANRPLGPIAKFGEELRFNDHRYDGQPNKPTKILQNSSIKVCNPFELTSTSDKIAASILTGLIDQFRKDSLAPKDVFDLDQWARFAAVNELAGSDHGMRWHNLRFYLNPNTNLIEPVGFDSESWFEPNKAILLHRKDIEPFYLPLVRDSTFMQKVNDELMRLSAPSYLDAFFDLHEDQLEQLEAILRIDDLGYHFSKQNYYNAQERIRSLWPEF